MRSLICQNYIALSIHFQQDEEKLGNLYWCVIIYTLFEHLNPRNLCGHKPLDNTFLADWANLINEMIGPFKCFRMTYSSFTLKITFM